MNAQKIEYINSIMLVCSLGAAVLLPFDTFLFSYAVLGPLHYLTELHWLKNRQFFINTNQLKSRKLFTFLMITIPFLLLGLGIYGRSVFFDGLNGLLITIFFILGILITNYFSINKTVILSVLSIMILVGVLYFKLGVLVILGIFLPTLVHVYLFTGLFMLMGYFKNPQKFTLLNIILLFSVPILIYLIPTEPYLLQLNSPSEKIYHATNFRSLNDWLITFLGISEEKQEIFFIKIQVFIAFAYTYHYLNWFSKTSVIGWSKTLGLKKGLFVLGIWILSIALYWKNYQLGLTVLFVLSMMHVLAEFPLNAVSIKTVAQKIFKK